MRLQKGRFLNGTTAVVSVRSTGFRAIIYRGESWLRKTLFLAVVLSNCVNRKRVPGGRPTLQIRRPNGRQTEIRYNDGPGV
ncbi:hypothetical protein EN837_04275 [bacterium M00.F.Ca.ET.194.01.1.1]|nr:hypothetical protein EN837_04275 [bacterium M00.F.Ca.ET.194.01.1.1]TGS57465.1 hypothetical protein EN822_04275 [bacterium M00.F.Ca.ET.179.01.1.1]TGV50397.1 hypothetical protein EN811_04275 [bacterium M00.F.Ca.ET.168.01.1.1]